MSARDAKIRGRRAPQGERGQSALLGVVALIVLAIGMYTTYNLSRSVYEKIEIQNAADATAYSLATMEARTFNFLAYCNRAQIANTVQMLEVQALLSTVAYIEGVLGGWTDAIMGTGATLKVIPFPPVAAFGEALYEAGNAVKTTMFAAAHEARVFLSETYVPRFIQVKTAANDALFAVGMMMSLATTAQLVDGGSDIVEANDPDARWHPAGLLALRGLNTAAFLNAFDFAAFAPQSSGQRNREAHRAMSELIDATRFHKGVFDDSFLVARKPLELLEGIAGTVEGIVGGAPGRLSNTLGPLLDILSIFIGPGFRGTSKLLKDQGDRATTLDSTRNTSFDDSDLPRGDTLVSKDQPLGFTDFAAVISRRQGGELCFYEEPSSHGTSIIRLAAALLGDGQKCEERDDLAWRNLVPGLEGGVQPFFQLAAHREGLTVAEGGFNQPDVWVWLVKSPEAMQLGPDRDLNFAVQTGGARARFDARIGEDGVLGSGLGEGMHAIARAQVYYHRPGAWREPPNFFNPYWAGRLARKGEALDRLFSFLPTPVSSYISDSLWMF